MLTLEQARAALLAGIATCTETETVSVAAAHGRFLAASITARVDNPAFDNTAMDGYAVNSADAARHHSVLPLVGESSCGSAPGVLTPGSAMRIFTGAPLPAGADTVVIQENVRVADGNVHLPAKVEADQNLRRRGEDFRAGDELLRAGRRLSVYDLALLSSAGVTEVPVYRRARVLVVATGNELVTPGEPLGPGQIYESNRLATLQQLRALDVDVVDGGTARDEPQALRALLRGATDFDFVITSGGASVGDHDLVKQVFAEIGEINFWKVRVKPGKPVAFGRVGARTHFLALPGNPVSSLVTYKLFVEPALYAWYHAPHTLVELRARATTGFRRQPGRTEFLRAKLSVDDGTLHATPLKGQGSHMLRPLAQTNGFIRIEADSSGFAADEWVTAVLLDVLPT